MATELYVGGWDNPSQQAVFGKIDSETGAYTQISSGLGMTFDSFTGLAWDPGISAFHTLSEQGLLSTITKTGTTGSPTGGGPRGRGRLAYNTNTGQLHRLTGENLMMSDFSLSFNGIELPPGSELWMSAEECIRKDSSLDGAAFVKGKLCCTVRTLGMDFYGFLDLESNIFQPISASDRAYSGMSLAYDGSTLFGLNDYTLYTLNPETGAYTQVAKVTGISEGNTMLECMSAIPVNAS